jgi:hypothetical protein
MSSTGNGSDGQVPRHEISDEMIGKVASAAAQVAEIKETFVQRVQTLVSQEEKDELEDEAATAAVEAIVEQGLSVDEFNHVVSAAEADPVLERRLLAAVRATY